MTPFKFWDKCRQGYGWTEILPRWYPFGLRFMVEAIRWRYYAALYRLWLRK